MKAVALLLCAASLLFCAEREGNFKIRFEPNAVLQTNAPIPFRINVTDDLNRPLMLAKVSLQVETTDHKNVKVYNAPSVGGTAYVAKPVFPVPGEWNVRVEVRQNDAVSARTIEFNVPETPAIH